MTRIFFVALLLFVSAIAAPFVVSAQKSDSYKDMAAQILVYINQHRAEKGLKPLMMNDVASQVALDHSTNMGSKKVPFSHAHMDDRVKRINKQLKQSASGWAENIATGQHNARGAVDSWLQSKGHRENIEGDYNMTGIGIAKGTDGSLYFTQIFIKTSK